MNTVKQHDSELTQAHQAATPVAANAGNRDNNFTFLRFLLATLVILSHAPELVDGNRKREPLTRLFGTFSLGELAVDGFFLLSGFLIVQSWQRKPQLLDFLKKRALRIYPGFVAASLLSALVVGPLGSNAAEYFAQFPKMAFLKSVLFLQQPAVPPVFQGQPQPSVNGALWTIAYEFRCYLLVAVLGLCGVVKRRQLWLLLSIAALLLSLSPDVADGISFGGSWLLIGAPAKMTRLLPFFCAGGCFYLFRERIRYRASWAILAGAVLLVCLFQAQTAQFALIVFGGYILFWFAFARIGLLERFKTYADISYGVYLYGWPTEKLLLWFIPSLSPWLLFPLALGLSCGCGWLSWHLVEHPFLRLKRQPNRPNDAPTSEGASEGAMAGAV